MNMLNSMTNVKEASVVSEYEDFVAGSAIYKDPTYPVFGLAGETGEVIELVKKAWRKNGVDWLEHIDKNRLRDELSDVMWYITRMTMMTGWGLNDLMDYNMQKLTARQEAKKKNK